MNKTINVFTYYLVIWRFSTKTSGQTPRFASPRSGPGYTVLIYIAVQMYTIQFEYLILINLHYSPLLKAV